MVRDILHEQKDAHVDMLEKLKKIAERNLLVRMNNVVIDFVAPKPYVLLKLSATLTLASPDDFLGFVRDMNMLEFNADYTRKHGTENDYFDSHGRGQYGIKDKRTPHDEFRATEDKKIPGDKGFLSVNEIVDAIKLAQTAGTGVLDSVELKDGKTPKTLQFPLKIQLDAPVVERYLEIQAREAAKAPEPPAGRKTYVGSLRG